ncbi:MAG: divalent metal cation transporter [Lachnospiraceae bacterium]|nr:divalent metal cation transporter [Lachnospiraceae bacterium]
MSENKKKAAGGGAILGAAFLMATSAIGPGFLTQTATFTSSLGASFGFVVLVAVILSAIAQLNIWKVLCGTGYRGQDIANKLLPGLGYFVSFMIVLGGLVFNIGNVGGGGLGLNTLFGLPLKAGYVVAAAIAILVFCLKNAKAAMDTLTKVLGGIMIVVILVIIFVVQPPVGEALKNTFMPSSGLTATFDPILTILGGTVGGYITFAGAHRLIDAGVTGEENKGEIQKSSVTGILVAAVVRMLLFLAILGVIAKNAGVELDSSNPVADAFLLGAGQIGYRFAGLVLSCAAVTSIIGAAYTSVSFLKTFNKNIDAHENQWVIGFIVVSTIIMLLVGTTPAVLLVFAGAFNGLILPITLLICLIAAKSKKIVGENFSYSNVLWVLGLIVVVISGYLGITTFISKIAGLF